MKDFGIYFKYIHDTHPGYDGGGSASGAGNVIDFCNDFLQTFHIFTYAWLICSVYMVIRMCTHIFCTFKCIKLVTFVPSFQCSHRLAVCMHLLLSSEQGRAGDRYKNSVKLSVIY